MTTRTDVEHMRYIADGARRELNVAERFVLDAEHSIERAERYLERPYHTMDERAEVRRKLAEYRESVLPMCMRRAEEKRRAYEHAAAELEEAKRRYLEEDPSHRAYWDDEGERKGAVCVV